MTCRDPHIRLRFSVQMLGVVAKSGRCALPVKTQRIASSKLAAGAGGDIAGTTCGWRVYIGLGASQIITLGCNVYIYTHTERQMATWRFRAIGFPMTNDKEPSED